MRFALLLALLTACASPDKRAANHFVKDGRFADAADVWMDALEADQDDPVARKNIGLVAPDAYASALDVAREQQAEGDLDGALKSYTDLIAFLDRLRSVDALTFPVEDIATERTDCEDALAKKDYEDGKAAVDAGKYLDGVTAFEAARKLRPDYEDTTKRMASALRLQAQADLAAKKFHDALDHYERSAELDHDPATTAWASSIELAYGRYYLKQGACRAAYTALSAARDSMDAGLAADLERARKCSRVEIAVTPFEDLTGAAVPGTALGALLSDKLAAGLRAQGSEHLRLVDDATTPINPADGRRYAIKGRVTRFQIERPDVTTDTRQGVGRTLVSCAAEESDVYDEAEGFLCTTEVPISWQTHTRQVVVHLGASLRVTEVGSAEVVLDVPLDSDLPQQVTWADHVQTADGKDAHLVSTPTVDGIAVDDALRTATAPPPALPSDGSLVTEALKTLSDAAIGQVLGAVDQGATAPEPAWLDVQAPVTDPSELQFSPQPGYRPGHNDAASDPDAEPI